MIIGKKVVKLGEHEPQNPCAIWCNSNGHGKPDMTLLIHRTVVDPDLPPVDTLEELTPAHFAWAENMAVEHFEKAEITATTVYELSDYEEEEPRILFPSWCP